MVNSNDKSVCLKCKGGNIEILYGIYLINRDSVDDDTVAVMMDADSI